MDALQEGPIITHLGIGRYAEQCFAAAIPLQDVVDRVVVPGADTGRFVGEAQSLGSISGRLFRSDSLDMRPRSFCNLGEQSEFALSPLMRSAVMNRHQGREPP